MNRHWRESRSEKEKLRNKREIGPSVLRQNIVANIAEA